MEIIYGLVTILIAWTWVDYFRLIDIYEKEKLKYYLITFILGWLSVALVLLIHRILSNYVVFGINGELINDFLYCTLGIGAIEEFAKMIPFILILIFFKKQLNEPVDYLIYISISALGFSAAENLLYFINHGPEIITSRAVLATISHMFDTSLIAYGIILYLYKNKSFMVIPGYFLLASLSHGIYDFLLMHEGLGNLGWALMLIYFLITINLYATILNNALNNSEFFTYKKIISAKKVRSHLYLYYFLIFVVQIFLMKFFLDTSMSWTEILGLTIFIAIIVSITITRLSRFTMIKGYWEQLKLEMPFTIYGSKKYIYGDSHIKFSVKGDSKNEIYLNNLIGENIFINPTNTSNGNLTSITEAKVIDKIFLNNKLSFFIVVTNLNGDYNQILIRPLTVGKRKINGKYPIVALFDVVKIEEVRFRKLNSNDLTFIDWAYITPIN